MHYKDELTELVKEALKEGVPALVKEYGDENITVISIDADNTTGFGDDYSFTVFVNTEENQERRMKDEDDPDPWYYRFCEVEMYIVPDPDCFEKTLTFLNEGYASGMAMNEVYECIVNAVEKLREEKFFDSVFPHDILIAINGSEVFGVDDMVKFIVRMNGEELSKDYVENTDSFI
jgi:hypothetical protein